MYVPVLQLYYESSLSLLQSDNPWESGVVRVVWVQHVKSGARVLSRKPQEDHNTGKQSQELPSVLTKMLSSAIPL